MIAVRDVVRVARENGWDLPRAYETLSAAKLGRSARRGAGLYYTPPEVAAEVVALAVRHGAAGRVLDPCCGAGVFLKAAAEAGFTDLHGIDLDPGALRVARLAVPGAHLRRGDSLQVPAQADFLLSNPPYGRSGDTIQISTYEDRYMQFLLRSLELVRPGGVVALLIPDTWMTNARSWTLRAEILRRAHLAAVSDLGKPFASAKDTRVQAVVLQRDGKPARTVVSRGREPLAPAPRAELEARVREGWQLYRTRAERDLCVAMETASVPLSTVCTVGYGMRTGANPRHVARRPPQAGEIGLVGGEDIVPCELRWRPKTLLDPAPLRRLVDAQLGAPRVAIQRIRTNSAAPWARWLEAAMVPAELVCLDSLSTLACASNDLLWALLGLTNSVAMNRWHRLRTTDVNVKPSALRALPVPRALVAAPRELAEAVRARAPERRIDALVYAAYGLREELVRESERGFWAERFEPEFAELQRMSGGPVKVRSMGGTP